MKRSVPGGQTINVTFGDWDSSGHILSYKSRMTRGVTFYDGNMSGSSFQVPGGYIINGNWTGWGITSAQLRN